MDEISFFFIYRLDLFICTSRLFSLITVDFSYLLTEFAFKKSSTPSWLSCTVTFLLSPPSPNVCLRVHSSPVFSSASLVDLTLSWQHILSENDERPMGWRQHPLFYSGCVLCTPNTPGFPVPPNVVGVRYLVRDLTLVSFPFLFRANVLIVDWLSTFSFRSGFKGSDLVDPKVEFFLSVYTVPLRLTVCL